MHLCHTASGGKDADGCSLCRGLMVISSLALPPPSFLPFLSWRVLSALTFFSCHSAWEGGNHLLRITPCSQANATALICSHVNTRIHECWTKSEAAHGETNTFLRCEMRLIKMKICVCVRDKSCKTFKRAGGGGGEITGSKARKIRLQIHSCYS